jgi:steroid delta-isomerase-like uncharacterized protein
METTPADNKTLVRRFVGDVVNEQRYELIDDLFTSDYTRHDPATPETEPGPGPWAESLRRLHEAFPDGEVHIGELVAEDDLVSFEGTMTGTHEGEFWGFEPTDASITVQGNAMHRIRDGKIAETWATWDFLGVLRQIGAIELPTE